MSTHLMTFLPLRVTCLRTVNPSGSLMTISSRRTEPALSYILSQFCFTRCLIRALEQNVGRVLALGSDPVVGHCFQKVRREWINLFGVTVEQTGPIQRTKTVGEFLSSRQILDPEKRIFPLGVADS